MSNNDSNQSKFDFSNFILSLNTSALIHMGDIPDPQTRERIYDLQSAKQTIDILELLRNKTRGNLDNEEDKGIYTKNEDGEIEKLGESITSYSFFDDKGNVEDQAG